jgi:hypothetical protein
MIRVIVIVEEYCEQRLNQGYMLTDKTLFHKQSALHFPIASSLLQTSFVQQHVTTIISIG